MILQARMEAANPTMLAMNAATAEWRMVDAFTELK